VKNLDQTPKSKAFALSLATSVLISINAAGLAVVARWFLEIMPVLPGSSSNDPMLFYTLSVIVLILGLIVLFAALMRRTKPSNIKAWGIMMIVFSAPSVIMGGGLHSGLHIGHIRRSPSN
jgi:hypothetical protein